MTAIALTIRTASDSDLQEIWRVHTGAISTTCARRYPPDVIAAWVERLKPESYRTVVNRGLVVIAEDGDQVVGFGQIDVAGGEIQAVYVSPQAQGRGVGGALLAHLEDLAARAGLARLSLKATLNAEPFYRTRGWQAVGHAVNKITERTAVTCVVMEKTLVRP